MTLKRAAPDVLQELEVAREVSKIELRELIAKTLLITYVFAVVATFAIIILWGLGTLTLPEVFVHYLGTATVGEIGGLLILVVKWLF